MAHYSYNIHCLVLYRNFAKPLSWSFLPPLILYDSSSIQGMEPFSFYRAYIPEGETANLLYCDNFLNLHGVSIILGTHPERKLQLSPAPCFNPHLAFSVFFKSLKPASQLLWPLGITALSLLKKTKHLSLAP